ncbi:MAG: hypothetical protein NZ920_00545 [Aigarchaeota archaeon]|nr:hypothetical protein [Aigarchaeota archaeon]MDW8092931.1 hypothetical protein [Nitrososphaerota archaeon]
MGRLINAWILVLRTSVGGFWAYSGVLNYLNFNEFRKQVEVAFLGNYVPYYNEFLQWAIRSGPLWVPYAIIGIELSVGALLLTGVFPRVAGSVGSVLAANLLMIMTFCDCSWNLSGQFNVFWSHLFLLLLNVALIRERHDRSLSILRNR